jgi:hypothetical protein
LGTLILIIIQKRHLDEQMISKKSLNISLGLNIQSQNNSTHKDIQVKLDQSLGTGLEINIRY